MRPEPQTLTKTTTETMKTEAYAKVNLTLEVFGVRGDGYHALRSIVAPISLSDTLEIEPSDGLSSDTGYPDDLILKAARALDPSRGARFRVTKRIPAGGGLGGGSADAAAALVALNEMWGLGRTREELAEIGAQVGSDVPALVLGGPVIMTGRGEFVERVECPRIDLVLVNPGINTSTREVYARTAVREEGGESATDACMEALESGEIGLIAESFANDLEAAACAMHPEIAEAMSALRAEGALGVTMSGSGSSAFGIVESGSRAQEIALSLRGRGIAAWAVHTLGADMV